MRTRLSIRKLAVPVLTIFLILAANGSVFAQSRGPATKELATATTMTWRLLAGVLVLFLQAGYALLVLHRYRGGQARSPGSEPSGDHPESRGARTSQTAAPGEASPVSGSPA